MAKMDKPLNELQMVLKVLEKLTKEHLENSSKTTVVFNRGTAQETKISYGDVLNSVKKLDSFFGVNGQKSLGICKDCKSFNRNTSTHPLRCWGSCRIIKNDHLHEYSTCDKHLIGKFEFYTGTKI